MNSTIEYFVRNDDEGVNIISIVNTESAAQVKIPQGSSDFPENSVVIVETLNFEDLNIYLVPSEFISIGVVNITAFTDNGIPILTFGEPVEICLAVTPETDKNGACLSFLNENNEWECEDECLDKDVNENGDTTLCGFTDHFTTFAILFTGVDTKCNKDDTVLDTTIAWISFGLICCALVFIVIGIILIEIRYRRRALEFEELVKNARESRIMALANKPSTTG